MMDITTLLPMITGLVSSAVQIGTAAHKWWKNQKDRSAQESAFAQSNPTHHAANGLHSLMDVQGTFWRSNPGMWQALGIEAAKFVQGAYSKSNGYVEQLARFAASMPQQMDWRSSTTGINGVQAQLKNMFADHLGKVISKMACRSFIRAFIPKEVKEAMAAENSKLLLQAQSSLGALSSQMAAGEQGTRRRLEQYEQQQAQTQQQLQIQYQQPQPQYQQQQQLQVQYPLPQQYQPQSYQQPQQPQQYQAHPQPLYQPQQQTYAQPQQQYQQQTYQEQLPTYTQSQAQHSASGRPDGENNAECIIT